MKRATGLDMTWGPFETSEAFVEGTVNADVPKFPALEAGFVVSGMVMG